MLRYEDLTNLTLVEEKVEGVIDFIGETKVDGVGNYTADLRPPMYMHGTLMAELCGIELARELYK